jgi:hypothetical protein
VDLRLRDCQILSVVLTPHTPQGLQTRLGPQPRTPTEKPMPAYPAFRYHRTLDPVVADDPTHELAVANPDDGWSDTPATFLANGEADQITLSGDKATSATATGVDTVATVVANGAAAAWTPPSEMREPAPAPAKRKR